MPCASCSLVAAQVLEREAWGVARAIRGTAVMQGWDVGQTKRA